MSYQWVSTPKPVYVSTVAEAEKWVRYYLEQPCVGFDTETNGLHKTKSIIYFFSFATADTRICAPARLLRLFAPILENPNIRKVMTNQKFDMHMAANYGIITRGEIVDTIAMDFLKDENREGRHGLKETAKDYLGLRMLPFSSVFGKVGSVDKEVEMVGRMHHAMEENDSALAEELLILVQQGKAEPEVLKALRRLIISRDLGYTLNSKQMLLMARNLGIAGRSKGKKANVVDFLEMVAVPVETVADRDSMEGLLGEKWVIQDAHDVMISELRRRVKLDDQPLDLLTFLVSDYSSLDAWASFMLEPYLTECLSDIYIDPNNTRTLMDHYVERGMDFSRTLWNMERRGIPLDLQAIEEMKRPLKKTIASLEIDFVQKAGKVVNLKSPQQLRELFYTKANGEWRDPFNNPPMKKTKGGASGEQLPSVDKESLEDWAERGDTLAASLLAYRASVKLYDNYLEGMPAWVSNRKRIHTDLKQEPVTGRLSSADPALQNIPVRTPEGKRIRTFFTAGKWGDASPDWCLDHLIDVPVPDLPADFPMTLVVADYKQLEMRLMAHFSEDESLCKVIRSGKDIHSMTVSLAKGINYEDIAKAKDKKDRDRTPVEKELAALRDAFKAIGFGLIYGIGPVKLGRQLGLPVLSRVNRYGRVVEHCPEAEALIEQYFKLYPGVLRFIEETKERCREDLYVQTYLGRFRRLPDIASDIRGIAARAERQSVNSRIQGTAADTTNEAMLKCERDPVLRRLGFRMLLQVHDELIFEAPNHPDFLIPGKKRLKQNMENPFPMRVPIEVDMNDGPNWGVAK